MPQMIAKLVRRLLLAILILGIVGTLTELVLLDHLEEARQWIPIILLSAGMFAIFWHIFMQSVASANVMRWIMFGFLASGLAGIYFHYQGSVEFKLESNPTLAGWALFRAAIRAKAPPLLAPGEMIQLGLLGLVYSYVNPTTNQGEPKGESL
ncbi:MAG: hypothetical protein ACREQO_21425 [Candidatus Binatia bacterium]